MPVVVLAWLAVDKDHQGKGLGQALLKDAWLRTAQAAVWSWYGSWEFESSHADAYHLFLMRKDLKGLLRWDGKASVGMASTYDS